jgi:NUMOD3 motif
VPTKEHSARKSKTLMGHKHSAETRKKISIADKGKPHSKRKKIKEFWDGKEVK